MNSLKGKSCGFASVSGDFELVSLCLVSQKKRRMRSVKEVLNRVAPDFCHTLHFCHYFLAQIPKNKLAILSADIQEDFSGVKFHSVFAS